MSKMSSMWQDGAEGIMGSNEYMGLYGINLNILELTIIDSNADSRYVRSGFTLPHRCAMMEISKRKEASYGGDHDGKVSHSERNCRDLKSVRRYYNETFTTKEVSRIQSRELLENKRERLARVYVQTKKRQRQQIKPAKCWHRIIEYFVAFRLLLTDCNPRRSSLRIRYPCFLSIALNRKEVKIIQTWVCDEGRYTHE